MIEGISAGAHEIERHDRSTCDIDLVVWCLAGGEIGARCDFGGKVLPLFFPLSLAAARLLLACLASPSAPAHALAPLPLAPGQISLLSLLSFASRTPPTLLSLFLLFVVVSLSLLLRLSLAFALVWIGYTSPLRDRHLACWSVCSRHLVDLLLVRIASCDSETSSLPLFAMARRKSKSKAVLGV